jgi:tetratricopeptide (TPR) repeat protein
MKNLNLFIFLGLFTMLLFIMACSSTYGNNVANNIEAPALDTPTPSYKISVFTLTPSPRPSITIAPTLTGIIYDRLTKTTDPRVFDASTIKTITPAAPAQCPVVDPDMTFDGQQIPDIYASDINEGEKSGKVIETYIEHLNTGGSFQSIIDGLAEIYGQGFGDGYQSADITGDGVNEIIIPREFSAIVLSCGNYNYRILENIVSGARGTPNVRILDLNNNGLNEFIIIDYGLYIYEWDGTQFNQLFEGDCMGEGGYRSYPQFKDIDGNQTTEIIYETKDLNFADYFDYFPAREETAVCMWNGKSFTLSEDTFAPPEFRFQAVQDGDRQMKFSNYELALDFYQQAIQDKTLDWYSIDRRIRDSITFSMRHAGEKPNPTATPVLFKDPDEYPILASYSYYRIAQIYLLQDDLATAQTIYNQQLLAFPADQAGGEFTEMSEILIQAYQESEDISQSCKAVTEYVQENRITLIDYSSYFNYTSKYYDIDSLCAY